MADWVPLGDRAARFPRPPQVSVRALVQALQTWSGVRDVVVTREDVAVYFDGTPRIDMAALGALARLTDTAAPSRVVEIRVVYDGPDLADVARAVDLVPDEVIRVHAAATYTVDTMGFAPGFAYLLGLDPRLALPRRSTPRRRVPAGSLAVAGGYTGVYPFDSPGGWHLLGRVLDIRMFGDEGAILRLGDRVRFVV